MPASNKAAISIRALETLVDEVLTEGAREYQDLRNKLVRAKPGTERHRSILCELSVAASILENKARIAQETIEEYLDSLPDDDED